MELKYWFYNFLVINCKTPIAPLWNWNTPEALTTKSLLPLQSHHYGIEISFLAYNFVSTNNSNRTIMELKLHHRRVWSKPMWHSNRTIMELKLNRLNILLRFNVYSNRTIMELKYNWWSSSTFNGTYSNRTIMELKYGLGKDKQANNYTPIAPLWNWNIT